VVHSILKRVSENQRLRRLATPFLRAYMRHAPVSVGKEYLWYGIIEPYFAWYAHDFIARTVFHNSIAGNTQDLIQQCLYYFGIWEPHLSCWINRRLRPGDVFVDVGCNIGYFSLMASRRVGQSGSVVAIEASPATFCALQDNLRRNRAGNVRAVNVAASDSAGTVKLFRASQYNIGETTTVPQANFELEGEIEAAPLSTILRGHEIERTRLIKIDVEGAECSVAAGMKSLLDVLPPNVEIVVELHPDLLAQQSQRPQDMVAMFQRAGFHLYSLEEDLLGPPVPSKAIPDRRTMKAPVRVYPPVVLDKETNLLFSREEAEAL
jgi:FkbM family methyltransferase